VGKLNGKVAGVTGASKGIGASLRLRSLQQHSSLRDDARWITGQIIVAAGGKRM
jgi:NAD(P)-dependent dehydrogenase (short-subunit alcohol dehydrogenase family)